ncbi:hypothetical protein Hanom_Chr16g01496041 [Helianthus anomalus]
MGIKSTLTKGMRRTGENNKPQLKCPSSRSSKTSFCFTSGSNQVCFSQCVSIICESV